MVLTANHMVAEAVAEAATMAEAEDMAEALHQQGQARAATRVEAGSVEAHLADHLQMERLAMGVAVEGLLQVQALNMVYIILKGVMAVV